MPYSQPNLFTALQSGDFSFAYGVPIWAFALLVIMIVAGVWLTYLKTTRPLTPFWKTLLIANRSTILVLLLFCLLRPVISTVQVSPQETYLAVLFDDSQSMSISDLDSNQTRKDVVAEEFYDDGILDELGESFQIRPFRFDKSTSRIIDEESLEQIGTASSIDQALSYVETQLSGLPLGGIVLVSDGADNSESDPIATAEQLGLRQIPIFTVGVGKEEIPQDIGIVDVSAAKTVLEGSVFTVQLSLLQQGYSGQQVALSIKDGETEVVTENVVLGDEGITTRFELEVTPDREERIVYELNVEVQSDELIAENNQYQFLVDNTEKESLDILYLEGHPRNEYKFIRRAVAGDSSIRLATYLQTGPEKYYRQGIESPTELSRGFPVDKEALYEYEALILGDIETSFFNADQLKMIEDFVAERGGGFLMSGMVDEEFIGTGIEDLLPLTLVEESFLPPQLRGGIRRGDHPTGEAFFPRRTNSGRFSPLLRFDSNDSANDATWGQLPELQGVYVTGRAKPGATVLLEHPLLQYQNQALPIIAHQRFGRGRSMSITSASTWRWQMMQDSSDQTHEILWRQLLRWLAVGSPERISIDFDREFYNVGDEVNVIATVLDEQYEPDNDATLWLQATDPLERATDTPMEWDIEDDGVYRSSFIAEEEGVYNLLVDVASAAGSSGSDGLEKNTAFVVTPSLREYTNAELDSGLLSRISDASGGSYFPISEVGSLPSAVEFTPNAYSQEVQIDLWDRPWLLALLILLLCADWILRRLRGLS